MFKNQDTTDQYTTDQDTTDQYTTDQDITNLNTFDQDTAVQESGYNWPRCVRPRYNWTRYNQLRYIWSSDQDTGVQESRYDRRRSNWLEYNPFRHRWPGYNWPKSSLTMISTGHMSPEPCSRGEAQRHKCGRCPSVGIAVQLTNWYCIKFGKPAPSKQLALQLFNFSDGFLLFLEPANLQMYALAENRY